MKLSYLFEASAADRGVPALRKGAVPLFRDLSADDIIQFAIKSGHARGLIYAGSVYWANGSKYTHANIANDLGLDYNKVSGQDELSVFGGWDGVPTLSCSRVALNFPAIARLASMLGEVGDEFVCVG